MKSGDSLSRQRTCPVCERSWPVEEWRKRRFGRICGACLRRRRRAEDEALAERSRAISRAWKDANRERNRERDRATQHRPCPTCGEPMQREANTCMACFRTAQAERQATAERMWAEGRTEKEIGAALGVASWTAAPYRKSGWDLPRRYPVDESGRRVAA